MSTRTLAILTAAVVFVAGALAALFVIQNGGRTTQLSLDLYVIAWQLKAPVPVSLLTLASFAVGALLGGGVFGLRWLSASRRAANLQRRLDLSSGPGSSFR